jgi:hypothetical protein
MLRSVISCPYRLSTDNGQENAMAKRPQGVTDDLKDLEERLAEVARRSPLSRWVMKNFDRLSGLVDDYGPHWGEMAKWMTERGVIGDQPVTGDALRKAFERERENKRKRDEPAKTQTPPKAQAASGPPPVRLLDVDRPAEPNMAFDKDEFLKGMKQSWER